jgi:hypothetical protein
MDRQTLALSVGRDYLQKDADGTQFHILITLTLECPLAPQHDINTECSTLCYTGTCQTSCNLMNWPGASVTS